MVSTSDDRVQTPRVEGGTTQRRVTCVILRLVSRVRVGWLGSADRTRFIGESWTDCKRMPLMITLPRALSSIESPDESASIRRLTGLAAVVVINIRSCYLGVVRAYMALDAVRHTNWT